MKRTDKHYISEIDKRLAEFDQSHPKTPSQKTEIDKYKRIYELRDNPTHIEPNEETLFED